MEWIRTKDDIPNIGELCDVVYKGKVQNQAWFLGDDLDYLFWYDATDEETEPAELDAFSHWRLRPQPPKDK